MNGSSTKFTAAVLALFLSASSAFAAELSEKEQSDIRTLVDTVMTRFHAGDPNAVVDVMPQAAIELFGGREALQGMSTQALQQEKARHMVFDKFIVGKISEPVMAGETTIVIVPTDVSMKMEDKLVEGTGFMIASRDKGSDKWQLLGGDGIDRNPGILQKIYKGFPAGVQFPPVKYELK